MIALVPRRTVSWWAIHAFREVKQRVPGDREKIRDAALMAIEWMPWFMTNEERSRRGWFGTVRKKTRGI